MGTSPVLRMEKPLYKKTFGLKILGWNRISYGFHMDFILKDEMKEVKTC